MSNARVDLVGWWMVVLSGGRVEYVRPEHVAAAEAMAAALRVWGVPVVSAERVEPATAHEVAVAHANRVTAGTAAQIVALRASDPAASAQHAAGRYRWPTLDALLDSHRDAWIEAALRAGADADRIGPSVDVAHVRRRIAVHG